MAEKPPTVTAEDQALINKFARSFQLYSQLKVNLKEAETEVENINEASDEILLLDEEDSSSIPMRIGQTFVHFDSDSLTERLEALKTKREEEVKTTKAKYDEIVKEMDRLKKILYGKFGDKINLETDKDD